MTTFLSVFPPHRGGISKFSDFLYRHLHSYEELQLRAVGFKKLYPDLLFPGKSQKVDYTGDLYAEPRLHSYQPFNWISTAKKIARQQPDALIYSFWHPFFVPSFWTVIRYLRYRLDGLRVVGIAHNVRPHENFPMMHALTRAQFDISDHVVLLSEQTEQEYNELGAEPPSTRLFHPVYNQPFPSEDREAIRSRYGYEDEDQVVLFFGLVREYKGLDLLIDAFNNLDLEALNIKPLIVGEFYTEKRDYTERINEEDRHRYQIIDRFVSEEEAAEIMTLSDLMALPYKTASQSGVLSNAINFQLPVLVSDLPGLREHIEHEKDGLIFKNNDVRSLETQIKNFIENNLRHKISSNLLSLKDSLSWDRFTRSFYNILKQ